MHGDIFFASLGHGYGSEQGGTRPVLIIQNNVGNKFSPTTIIAPISGKVKTKAILPTHYCLEACGGLREPSVVLLEQIRVVDKKRLVKKLGHLPKHHTKDINQALKVSLGLHAHNNL